MNSARSLRHGTSVRRFTIRCRYTFSRRCDPWVTAKATSLKQSGPRARFWLCPIFPEIREDEQETVVAAIAEFLSH